MIGLGLVVGACKSTMYLDTANGEKVMIQALKDKGGDVKSLNCPRDVEVKPEATFDCNGKMADGRDISLHVKIVDAKGNISYKVSKLGDHAVNEDVELGAAAKAGSAAPTPAPAPAPGSAEPAAHEGSAAADEP